MFTAEVNYRQSRQTTSIALPLCYFLVYYASLFAAEDLCYPTEAALRVVYMSRSNPWHMPVKRLTCLCNDAISGVIAQRSINGAKTVQLVAVVCCYRDASDDHITCG